MGIMQEEGEAAEVLPEYWKERGRYIGRFLAVFFSHKFVFESDVFDSLDNLPEFLNFCFTLVGDNTKEFVRNILKLFKISGLSAMPKDTFSNIIEQLQNLLAIYVISLVNKEDTLQSIKFTIKCLSYLHESNLSKERVDKEEFINETVSGQLNMHYIAKQYYQRSRNQQVMGGDFVYLDYPWMFSTAAKVDVLQSEANIMQNEAIVGQIMGGIGNSGMGLLGLVGGINLKLNIRRQRILEDALNQLSGKGAQLKKPLKIKFVGEQGVDEGGVKKEFFHLLVTELFNPNYAMFLEKNVS